MASLKVCLDKNNRSMEKFFKRFVLLEITEIGLLGTERK
jgi:hypothetical protein